MVESSSNDWTEDYANCWALSVRQPWAWLIVNGFKDVENRTRRTHVRGPILIHAGLNQSDCRPEHLEDLTKSFDLRLPDEFNFGGVVGVASIVDCCTEHASKWYQTGSLRMGVGERARVAISTMQRCTWVFQAAVVQLTAESRQVLNIELNVAISPFELNRREQGQ